MGLEVGRARCARRRDGGDAGRAVGVAKEDRCHVEIRSALASSMFYTSSLLTVL